MAPISQILVADFTRDGKVDLLAVGNDAGADAETYHVDASKGCLLAGDGKGGLKLVPNKISGLRASGEVRDPAWFQQMSGKNVLVLSLNNSQTRAFYSLASE